MATKQVTTKRIGLKKLTDVYNPYMGCDPEFFIRNKGEVVGAEKLLPKGGLTVAHGSNSNLSKFIIDGVQAELNPRPNTCREGLAAEISRCMMVLQDTLKSKGMTADFSQAVEIKAKELDTLSDDAKKFGCAPSLATYDAGIKIESVDPTKYLTRAAGGHIHIGLDKTSMAIKEAEKTVRLLDIICGNTCVLMDRDKGNIERRKLYGRAGEYRLPKHGLEYRTPSNFWLTAIPLMSIVFGLARLAVQLSYHNNREQYYKAITGAVKEKDIINAINNNDFDLAMKNFMKVEQILCEIVPDTAQHVITIGTIHDFYHFIDRIYHHGLSYWFKSDPITHWTTGNGTYGARSFLLGAVHDDKVIEDKKKLTVNPVVASGAGSAISYAA